MLGAGGRVAAAPAPPRPLPAARLPQRHLVDDSVGPQHRQPDTLRPRPHGRLEPAAQRPQVVGLMLNNFDIAEINRFSTLKAPTVKCTYISAADD